MTMARRIWTKDYMDTLTRLVADPDAWGALATLIAMEVVLGVDNLVFIALLSNRVEPGRRMLARGLGLSVALVLRLALLASAVAIVHLTEPLATVFGHPFSARDLLLLAGGLFLVWKATTEIHERVDPDAKVRGSRHAAPLGLASAFVQIMLIDIVFSIDSIITAVGMTNEFPIMVAAVVVAVVAMMVASGPLGAFINRNPTVADAGAELPPDDRHDADRRRVRLPYRKGLYLRGDVLLLAGRGAQRARQAQIPEGEVTPTSLVLFAAVYFAAVATPGPGVAALVARVLGHGLGGAAPFIAGYVVGDLIWLILAATGLSVLANAFAGLFVALKYAGAAYLLYVAWRMATAPVAVGEQAPAASRGWRAFFGSLSLTLGNPKVMIFFLSIMPLVVDVRTLTPLAIAELAATSRARHLLRRSRLTRSPPTAPARSSARPAPCASPVAPPAARWRAWRSPSRRGEPCRTSSRSARRWSSSTRRGTARPSCRGSAATRRTR